MSYIRGVCGGKYWSGLLLLALVLCSVIGCSKGEVNETVEVYGIEYMPDVPNTAGMYEVMGYKRSNAITYISKTKSKQIVNSYVIEDLYDLQGQFVESRVRYDEDQLHLITSFRENRSDQTVLDRPMTILTDTMLGEDGQFISLELTEEQAAEVKAHVMGQIRKLREK